MNRPEDISPPPRRAGFLPVLTGVAIFLIFQYGLALWRLASSSGHMANKFSALARESYFGFLVVQNLRMLIAYAILAVIGAWLVQPLAGALVSRWRGLGRRGLVLIALVLAALVHGFLTFRLSVTRPYFMPDGAFYHVLDFLPSGVRPGVELVVFTLFPLAMLAYVILWHLRQRGRAGKALVVLIIAAAGLTAAIPRFKERPHSTTKSTGEKPLNVLIIASDSLRADRLGCAGYQPARKDGPAAAGVSPAIDALAARSIRFENCYTAIASTMESGTQLMSSTYPQSNGIRQMYPDRATVEAMQKRVVTLPTLLREKGYDTAAIGDWCAGYYEVVGLGMEDLSVSTFDNFKIYMSQAVVMAHFVVPLYFDHPLGDRLFPEMESFANFVKPDVVTRRVEQRLATAARDGRPFFWHVFYSCNHLPYSSPEPYRSMFADPAYDGPNRDKVAFDIDSFIGGTDLESKWKALPPAEMQQIRALYDGCTRQFDDCVGSILSSLKANGLDENTVVIITSDHGDDQYEPGVTLGHGLTFNGGLQANKTPMIVHVPGTAPRVIPEIVRHIDVIPTLADLVGQEKSPLWQGRSFADWIKGGESPMDRPFYGETGFPFIQFSVAGVERPKLPPMDELTYIEPDFNYQFVLKPEYLDRLIAAKQRCLRTRDWKLVCTPTAAGTRHFALFHMTADPDAENDLAPTRLEVLAPMRSALELWMDQQIETPIAGIFPQGEPQ
ncbi:MAG: sulfatase-like hydrolase/transferase [Verrucomicrobiota bacterium]